MIYEYAKLDTPPCTPAISKNLIALILADSAAQFNRNQTIRIHFNVAMTTTVYTTNASSKLASWISMQLLWLKSSYVIHSRL